MINNVNLKWRLSWSQMHSLQPVSMAPWKKKKQQLFLPQWGLPFQIAVRLMLIKIAQEHALPFDPFVPNDETIAAMKEARRGKLAPFKSVEDLMEDLNAPDWTYKRFQI